MSTIPVSLTEKEFTEHVLPYLSVAKRGYVSKIPLYRIFNYVLYRLHTGCQWYRLPVAFLPDGSEKKKSVIMLFTIIFASGVRTVA